MVQFPKYYFLDGIKEDLRKYKKNIKIDVFQESIDILNVTKELLMWEKIKEIKTSNNPEKIKKFNIRQENIENYYENLLQRGRASINN